MVIADDAFELCKTAIELHKLPRKERQKGGMIYVKEELAIDAGARDLTEAKLSYIVPLIIEPATLAPHLPDTHPQRPHPIPRPVPRPTSPPLTPLVIPVTPRHPPPVPVRRALLSVRHVSRLQVGEFSPMPRFFLLRGIIADRAVVPPRSDRLLGGVVPNGFGSEGVVSQPGYEAVEVVASRIGGGWLVEPCGRWSGRSEGAVAARLM